MIENRSSTVGARLFKLDGIAHRSVTLPSVTVTKNRCGFPHNMQSVTRTPSV